VEGGTWLKRAGGRGRGCECVSVGVVGRGEGTWLKGREDVPGGEGRERSRVTSHYTPEF
jgi:hypothetical protein